MTPPSHDVTPQGNDVQLSPVSTVSNSSQKSLTTNSSQKSLKSNSSQSITQSKGTWKVCGSHAHKATTTRSITVQEEADLTQHSPIPELYEKVTDSLFFSLLYHSQSVFLFFPFLYQ